MRIAQLAPLYESCPPRSYGGTERIVSYLTEELVARGHEVTLFASGDSVTTAELRPICSKSLRLGEGYGVALAYHLIMLDQVDRAADRFDIVHVHAEWMHLPLSRRHPRVLTTLHGRLDVAELSIIFKAIPGAPVVSISNSQRAPLRWLNWQATIPHGLPPGLLSAGEGGGYLAFLGRIAPEKGVDRAIQIAGRAGVPLRIAAKIDPVDLDYFETVIRPMLSGPHVEFIGEIGDREKSAFLGNAMALLFPICWPEPFGLSMIEAMACGTPVIAFRAGAVPEVIDEGITGFVVADEASAVAAVSRVPQLDRRLVRQTFETRFSVGRMTRAYLDVYAALASDGDGTARPPRTDDWAGMGIGAV